MLPLGGAVPHRRSVARAGSRRLGRRRSPSDTRADTPDKSCARRWPPRPAWRAPRSPRVPSSRPRASTASLVAALRPLRPSPCSAPGPPARAPSPAWLASTPPPPPRPGPRRGAPRSRGRWIDVAASRPRRGRRASNLRRGDHRDGCGLVLPGIVQPRLLKESVVFRGRCHLDGDVGALPRGGHHYIERPLGRVGRDGDGACAVDRQRLRRLVIDRPGRGGAVAQPLASRTTARNAKLSPFRKSFRDGRASSRDGSPGDPQRPGSGGCTGGGGGFATTGGTDAAGAGVGLSRATRSNERDRFTSAEQSPAASWLS